MSKEVMIAFSTGLESTYLLQRAVEQGYDVTLCHINVSSNPIAQAVELQRTLEIAQWVNKNYLRSDHGKVVQIQCYHRSLITGCSNRNPSQAVNIVQQFNTALGMLLMRRDWIVKNEYPGVWVGWIKEDTFEHSLDPWDYSQEQYQAFLNFPVTLGKLSSCDFKGVPFSAPLWATGKYEIWESLNPSLRDMILPNFSAISINKDLIRLTVSSSKQDEFKEAGLPVPEDTVNFNRDNLNFLSKLLGKLLKGKDFGLPDSMDSVVKTLCEEIPSRSVSFSFPVESQFKSLEEEFTERLFEVIKLCQGVELPIKDSNND